jgi:hypothetical protein
MHLCIDTTPNTISIFLNPSAVAADLQFKTDLEPLRPLRSYQESATVVEIEKESHRRFNENSASVSVIVRVSMECSPGLSAMNCMRTD